MRKMRYGSYGRAGRTRESWSSPPGSPFYILDTFKGHEPQHQNLGMHFEADKKFTYLYFSSKMYQKINCRTNSLKTDLRMYTELKEFFCHILFYVLILFSVSLMWSSTLKEPSHNHMYLSEQPHSTFVKSLQTN